MSIELTTIDHSSLNNGSPEGEMAKYLDGPDVVNKGKKRLGEFFKSSRKKGFPGIPLLSVTLHDGLVVRDSLERRTETNINPEYHLLVQEGFIAYNMMRAWQGALGRATADGLVSPAYVVLKPTSNIDSTFAEYLFKTPRMIYLFWVYSYGLTRDRLRLYYNDFARIPVELPSLPEQKKIAKILSMWDKTITTTEQLLSNSQQQKKALMQLLFTGKKRIPGFSGEFKRYHFLNLLEIDAKNLGKKTPADFEFDYISLSDVETGRIDSKLGRYKFQDAPSRARRVVTEGDILLATVRPNLQSFVKIRREHSGCIASTGFAVLAPKENVCGDYIYHYLFGAHITGQINVLVTGTNYPAINSSDVAGLLIYCPEYDEQQEIAQVLNNCDSTISALQRKLHCLEHEKKALMQQLLTGKRRVTIDSREVA